MSQAKECCRYAIMYYIYIYIIHKNTVQSLASLFFPVKNEDSNHLE
jgi:hypothetical protein